MSIRGRLARASDRPSTEPRVPGGVRLRRLVDRGDLRVWLVDGYRIRTVLDVDFTMGGNEARYAYVPRNEIWIDSVLGEADREATILHEVEERRLMLDEGLDYDQAHDLASVVERRFRMRRG